MALRISILLNLVLLGGMGFLLKDQTRENIHFVPASPKNKPAVQAAARPVPAAMPGKEPETFRWRQLESSKSYRDYIANLRAIGCPEATIADIVRGDVGRTFSWERDQLGLEGTGTGPWSQSQERQLVASLLNGQPLTETINVAQSGGNSTAQNEKSNEAAETTESAQSMPGQAQGIDNSEVAQTTVPSKARMAGASSYPFFLQNVNWGALGFTSSQQAAIAQVRQQFLSEINSPSQNSSGTADSNSAGSAALTRWQTAMQNADDQLRALLGNQAYNNYVQQKYWNWYQPQVETANAEGGAVGLNLGAFSQILMSPPTSQ